MVFDHSGQCPHCGMELIVKTNVRNVAIVVYDGMEILDFSGPAEVFSSASNDSGSFRVFTVATSKNMIVSQNFVKIEPQYTFSDCPMPDIVVIPGGNPHGSVDHDGISKWVGGLAPQLEIVMSVCTGAFFLADAGLFEHKKVTTFHNAIGELRKQAPNAEVLEGVRWVEDGKLVTTAGVSAGIDGSLHVVARLLGDQEALDVVKYMEYDAWKPDNGLVVQKVVKQ
jgi:transcriptional regulator GlxA family with amidase domain